MPEASLCHSPNGGHKIYRVSIYIALIIVQGILRKKHLQGRIIAAGPVVQEARTIILAGGIGKGIPAQGRAAGEQAPIGQILIQTATGPRGICGAGNGSQLVLQIVLIIRPIVPAQGMIQPLTV